jgi:hypothetical protein
MAIGRWKVSGPTEWAQLGFCLAAIVLTVVSVFLPSESAGHRWTLAAGEACVLVGVVLLKINRKRRAASSSAGH